jgi:hypothetical protein
MTDLIIQNVFSVFTMFFALGVLASLVQSDLKFPDAAGTSMGIFLLAAIGLRAGVAVSKVGLCATVLLSALAAVAVGVLLAVVAYALLRSSLIRLDPSNAGSVAGHFGAVSSATLVMSVAFVEDLGIPYDAFVPGLYPFMDTAALVTAIILARLGMKNSCEKDESAHSLKDIIIESMTARTTLLLLGCLLIGFIAGEGGAKKVMPLFDSLFHGVTALFMLEIGVLAGARLAELKGISKLVIAFGVFMPFFNILIGALTAAAIGLDVGGITIFAIGLAGGCSFISAPIVMRTALPHANPSLSLGLALIVAFPFNITLGIPFAYQLALLLVDLF